MQKLTKLLFISYFFVAYTSLFSLLEKSTLLTQCQKRLDTLYEAKKFYINEQVWHPTYVLDRIFFRSARSQNNTEMLSHIDCEISKTAHYLSEILQKDLLNDNEKKEAADFLKRQILYTPSFLKKHRQKFYTAGIACILFLTFTQQCPQKAKTIYSKFKKYFNSFFTPTKKQSPPHEGVYDFAKQCHENAKAILGFVQDDPSLTNAEKNYLEQFENKENSDSLSSFLKKAASLFPVAKDLPLYLNYTYAYTANLLLLTARTLYYITPYIESMEQLTSIISLSAAVGAPCLVLNRLLSQYTKKYKAEVLVEIQTHLNEAKRNDIAESRKAEHLALFWFWSQKLEKINSSNLLSRSEQALLQPLCYALKDSTLALSTKLLLIKNYIVH